MNMMKQKFLQSMMEIYPDGSLPLNDNQIRDMVRAFSAGWAESLCAVNMHKKAGTDFLMNKDIKDEFFDTHTWRW